MLSEMPERLLDYAVILTALMGALTLQAHLRRARSAHMFIVAPALLSLVFLFWASPLRHALLTTPAESLQNIPGFATCYFAVIIGFSASAALSGYAFWRVYFSK